jgi:hypothetical protein
VFDFDNFYLGYLKGVQNSVALHTEIYLIPMAWGVGRHKVPALLK